VELWRGAAAAGQRDAADLERAAVKACKDASAIAGRVPFVAPDADYWLGECEWIRRQPVRARRRWERALSRARALDMPFAQARAHLALSRIDEASPAARAHRERAVELFAGAGVPVSHVDM